MHQVAVLVESGIDIDLAMSMDAGTLLGWYVHFGRLKGFGTWEWESLSWVQADG